jgi:hypothetical protein
MQAGALASLFAMCVFYPVDLWKVRVQATKDVVSGKRTSDALVTVLKELVQGHLSGFWRKVLHTVASSFVYFYAYALLKVCNSRCALFRSM